MADPMQEVLIDYTNWRGERSVRRIRPLRIVFENNEWHPDTQWLLEAVDLQKGEERTFALSNIHTWRIAQEQPGKEPRLAEKMTAAEIIYAALVWGEEGMLSMIGGLDDSDPYKAEVSDQWKQLRAYRRRRFGKERSPFEGCKTVTLDEIRNSK